MMFELQATGTPNVRERAFYGEAHRVVESQVLLSLRSLVDSDAEHELLEAAIDRAKPPAPSGEAFRGLHFLLSTPFRHPPLRWGSRFGRVHERGIFYASLTVTTAMAEVAYYRLLFLEASRADLGMVSVELTAFRAAIAAPRTVDLTQKALAPARGLLEAKASYALSHAVGTELRARGVDGLLFRSARCPAGGINLALFRPAFASKRPAKFSTWSCFATRDAVEMREKGLGVRRPRALRFERTAFEVEGELPRSG